ncbi:MAG: hypothetical protein HOP02_01480 [Methylococcaceae bacterium]|nr:hypothetical protein [Methylococcaceae bacterium]
MYKIILSSFMLLSAASYADNTPTFDFATGVLSMPFVSTSQGNYMATLQIDPNLPATTFTILQAEPTVVAANTTTPPTFSFTSGLLNLPKVNTTNGTYTAKLQLAENLFKLTAVQVVGVNIPTGDAPAIAGCSIFPSNNAWNTAINALPVHPRSAAWINTIRIAAIHTDFGADYGAGPFGQPINIVAGSTTPKYTFNFQIPIESDTGPYPVPDAFLREATDDKRLFIVDTETCKLYETYNANKTGAQWSAKRGAIWDMKSNGLRPLGSGSADEGGFPTVPGLVRYDEVASGIIKHALRFTFPKPNTAIWPARHTVGAAVAVNNTLPMGARLRLKDSVDISAYAPELQVILQAMKTYGIMLTDDGSALYLSGTPDERWNNDMLSNLRAIKGGDFEAVDSECMQVSPDSGEANPGKC